MGASALWLSRQERVEVEDVVDANPYGRYKHPVFRIRRSDGTAVEVERRDILLQEEERLIDEMAQILYHSGNPAARHPRYAELMRYFLAQGVPYVHRLQMKKPVQAAQIAFDLYDAG